MTYRHMTTLLALLFALAPLAAQPASGPGRIAVGGAYPTGWTSALARWGLPADTLYDAQLTDESVWQRYDLVIIAGLAQNGQLPPAADAFLAGGGALIVDLGADSGAIVGWLTQRFTGRGRRGNANPQDPPGQPWLDGLGFSTAEARAAGGSPIAEAWAEWDALLAETGVKRPRLPGIVVNPGALQNPVTLAEFPYHARFDQLAALLEGRRNLNDLQPEDMGATPGPAIVSGDVGPGRVVVIGTLVSAATSVNGLNADPLMIELVRYITDGRAHPQIETELPRLARNQVLGAAAPEAMVTADVYWPEPLEVGGLPRGYTELAAASPDEFDLTTTIPRRGGNLLIGVGRNVHARLDVSPERLLIVRQNGRQATELASADVDLPAGTPVSVKRRVDALLVVAGDTILQADLGELAPGPLGARGFDEAPALQTIESPYFTDDFMRTNEHQGGWQTSGADWETVSETNPELGANPFAYKVDATGGLAQARQGEPGWSDYYATVAVQPNGPTGHIGLGWYAQGDDDMYLLRAIVGRGRAGGLELGRLSGGEFHPLATASGGLANGQWYQLAVQSAGPQLTVWVDGRQVIQTTDTTFSGGGLVLRAEGVAARFDDVVLQSWGVRRPTGDSLDVQAPAHAGLMDLDSWAGPAGAWRADPAEYGLFWQRDPFWGDVEVSFTLSAVPSGQALDLMAEADAQGVDSGLRLHAARRDDSAQLTLFAAGKQIARGQVAVDEGAPLALARDGERVVARLGGREVLAAEHPAPAGAGRLGFRTAGYKTKLSNVGVWAANLRDTSFDTAPIDWWVGSGEWDLTSRWTCSPEWSWFGGVSEDIAAVWSKQSLAGEMSLDWFAAPKMLYVGEPDERGRQRTSERNGDLNAVICGNGYDPESGYSFLINPTQGGAYLSRDGEPVASNTEFRLPTRFHNRWSHMRAERHGATLTLFVDGQEVLSYTDPDPLPEGYAGLWTRNNGLMIPRATLTWSALGRVRLGGNG